MGTRLQQIVAMASQHNIAPADRHIRLIQDDVLTTTLMKPASIALIVTSSPYNVGMEYASHLGQPPIEVTCPLREPGWRAATSG